MSDPRSVTSLVEELFKIPSKEVVIQELPDNLEFDWTRATEVNTSKDGKRKHFNWASGPRGSERKRKYGGTFDVLPLWRQELYYQRSEERKRRGKK